MPETLSSRSISRIISKQSLNILPMSILAFNAKQIYLRLQRPELFDSILRETQMLEHYDEVSPYPLEPALENYQVNHVLRLSPLSVLETVCCHADVSD